MHGHGQACCTAHGIPLSTSRFPISPCFIAHRASFTRLLAPTRLPSGRCCATSAPAYSPPQPTRTDATKPNIAWQEVCASIAPSAPSTPPSCRSSSWARRRRRPPPCSCTSPAPTEQAPRSHPMSTDCNGSATTCGACWSQPTPRTHITPQRAAHTPRRPPRLAGPHPRRSRTAPAGRVWWRLPAQGAAAGGVLWGVPGPALGRDGSPRH